MANHGVGELFILMKISLIIPILNEAESIIDLIETIDRQTLQPNEVIFVDGGSSDGTTEIIRNATFENPLYKITQTFGSSPGKGRNIGIENAQNEWIALTDAGIKLDRNWLAALSAEVEKVPDADVVYGNFSPQNNSFFEKCAALSYVPPLRENTIRGRSVASMLLRKKVWEEVGGFPDLRAAEDLIFMETIAQKGFKPIFAPDAVIYWHLRPNLLSTFRKFVLYSKHNVLAGRQWDWHYGVLKQYVLVLLFVILAIVQCWWWSFLPLLWLIMRTAKRIHAHYYEYGLMPLLNPIYFVSIMFVIIIIDIGTFTGWVQALLLRKD